MKPSNVFFSCLKVWFLLYMYICSAVRDSCYWFKWKSTIWYLAFDCTSTVYVIVKSIFVTVFTINGEDSDKYTLNSLVSDLFCDRQRM